jgi:hypothetical protein
LTPFLEVVKNSDRLYLLLKAYRERKKKEALLNYFWMMGRKTGLPEEKRGPGNSSGGWRMSPPSINSML